MFLKKRYFFVLSLINVEVLIRSKYMDSNFVLIDTTLVNG